MLQFVQNLCDPIVDATANDLFFTFQEGNLKTAVVRQLLALGATIQEGINSTQAVDYVQQHGNALTITRAPRTIAVTSGWNPDVICIKPGVVIIELKSRSLLGSRSQVDRRIFAEDMDRLGQRKEILVLFVFEEDSYLSFSGQGNTSRSPIANFFRPIAQLIDGQVEERQWNNLPVFVRYKYVDLPNGRKRIFTAVWRSDAPSIPLQNAIG